MKTAGAAMVIAAMVFMVGQSAAAQRSIRVRCKAAIRDQAAACIDIPREGATLAGPNVRVVLKSAGISLGAAHYHLFLDVDVPPAGEAIPQGPGVTHLGSGEKAYVLENLAPGLHRLIVVLGDNAHIAVPRQQSDTAYFAVTKRS